MLALVARRVFSSQGMRSRVASDGHISGEPWDSDAPTPVTLPDGASLSLPRIRTRVGAPRGARSLA